MAKEPSDLGKKLKATMDKGELVADDFLLKILGERAARPDCARGFILDGTPRNLAQAEKLSSVLKPGSQLIAVLVDLPDAECIKRISSRYHCPGCNAQYNTTASPPKKAGICDKCSTALAQRSDDTKEGVTKRLKIYHESTEPVVKYYEKERLLVKVDGGAGSADAVWGALRPQLQARRAPAGPCTLM